MTLKDMLRACVLAIEGNQKDLLFLIELTYNNNYRSSIGMALYEELYGRRCITPLCWMEVSGKGIIGPKII